MELDDLEDNSPTRGRKGSPRTEDGAEREAGAGGVEEVGPAARPASMSDKGSTTTRGGVDMVKKERTNKNFVGCCEVS